MVLGVPRPYEAQRAGTLGGLVNEVASLGQHEHAAAGASQRPGDGLVEGEGVGADE